MTDGVVPGEFAFSGTGYLAPCEGIDPPHKIMSNISGIDLVQDVSGEWFVLEGQPAHSLWGVVSADSP